VQGFPSFVIGHGNDVESDSEQTLVVVIDDALSKHSGGGLIPRSELVDTLLDLRLTVSELAVLASLDPQSTPERPAHTATMWHWHREHTSPPSRRRS